MRIILLGFGTVGQALARILLKEMDRFIDAYGFEPRVTGIADSQGFCSDEAGLDLALALKVKETKGTISKYPGKGQRTTESSRLIASSESEVAVETTPSNFTKGEPGLSNIKQSLSTGKHVITANKGPLALAMPALLELAAHKKLKMLFSGTVGGGTPFLSFASKCLSGEKILGVRGILNGTSNYILTRMEDKSLTFKKALLEAQQKGYAESDPSNDVEGLDTAAKMVIIANWVMKRRITLHDMKITGISSVTPERLKRARTSGSRLKLVGRLSESETSVRPEEVPLNDSICVPDTLNALTFSTEHTGDMTLIGQGAGGEQTAGAIIRDLVDIRQEYKI